MVEQKILDNMQKRMTKNYAEGILHSAQHLLNDKDKIISVSPVIDMITNGGIPERTWTILAGPEKYGKTTLALMGAVSAQKQGKYVVYIDAEQRLKQMNLSGIPGLNVSEDAMMVVRSCPEKILYLEDYLNIILDYLREMPCYVIVDSFSALALKKVADEGVGAETMGKQNHFISDFVNVAQSLIHVHKSCIVGIAQYYKNSGGYGKKNIEKIATRILYQGDIKLVAKKKEDWVVSGKSEPIGHKVEWFCEFSALGPPGKSAESYIRYGYGIDKFYELVELGINMDFIERKGKWYSPQFITKHIPGYEIKQCDGFESLMELMKSDEILQKYLCQDLSERMGTNVSI